MHTGFRYRSVFQEAFLAVLAVSSLSSMAVAVPTANPLEISTTAGTFRGTSTTGLETWFGIPFAEPPVGNLRFKAPIPLRQPRQGVSDALSFAPLCAQPTSSAVSEDCLYINIWRPQNVSSDAKLPVLFWIHGGGYTTGSSGGSNPQGLIERSVEIGKPFIFVSTSYRLNTFGFLASSSVAPEDLNAGLLDQRMALSFVQDNIAAFGGDPSKVTIWGQSAGAGGMESHFLYPSSRPLFRAGISDSSTGPFKSSPVASVYDEPGKPFARLLSATNCTSGRTAVQCLQAVPFQTLLNISNDLINSVLNQQLWEPAIGPAGSMIPEEVTQRIKSGNFLRLPYLAGTNLNEGNGFSGSVRGLNLRGAQQDARFDTYIRQLLIDDSKLTDEVLDRFHQLYPANDPTLGAPFNTGDSLFDRAAAWYTDVMYLAPRRLFVDRLAEFQRSVYVYSFREFTPGNDVTLGVSHGSELAFLFGPLPRAASSEQGLSDQMRDFYINFVNDLNPGSPWAPFRSKKQVLQIIKDNVTMIDDTFLRQKTDFINTDRVLAELQK